MDYDEMDSSPSTADKLTSFIRKNLNFDYGMGSLDGVDVGDASSILETELNCDGYCPLDRQGQLSPSGGMDSASASHSSEHYSDTESEKSCSSQDTMVLIGTDPKARNQSVWNQGVNPATEECPCEGEPDDSGLQELVAAGDSSGGLRQKGNSDGVDNDKEETQQQINMHIDYFSGIHQCDENLEEANEGSPEPLAFENRYLLGKDSKTGSPSPGIPSQRHHNLPAHVREEDEDDDGYDSPGGQSSETSSTESTKSRPLKSILPDPGQKTKKKVVKKVRFETLGEDPDESSPPPPVPPPPKEDKVKLKHSYLFESDVKIPSFKKMNSMLREQRENTVKSKSGEKASSLEKQLMMLTMEEASGDENEGVSDDVAKELSPETNPTLSPGSVSTARRVLYSDQTHVNVPNPGDVEFDSETGERQFTGSSESLENPGGSVQEDESDLDSSFIEFIHQRDHEVSAREALMFEQPEYNKRRVHFAEPLSSDIGDMNSQDVVMVASDGGEALHENPQSDPNHNVSSQWNTPGGHTLRQPQTTMYDYDDDLMYIDSHYTETVLQKLNELHKGQRVTAHNRDLLRTNAPSGHHPEVRPKSNYVILRQSDIDKVLPLSMDKMDRGRPKRDQGSNNHHPSLGLTPKLSGSIDNLQQDWNRPKFASSADIYGMLERNRQNPFRPVPSHIGLRKRDNTCDVLNQSKDNIMSMDKQVDMPSSQTHPPVGGPTVFEPTVTEDMDPDVRDLWESVKYGDAKYTAL